MANRTHFRRVPLGAGFGFARYRDLQRRTHPVPFARIAVEPTSTAAEQSTSLPVLELPASAKTCSGRSSPRHRSRRRRAACAASMPASNHRHRRPAATGWSTQAISIGRSIACCCRGANRHPASSRASPSMPATISKLAQRRNRNRARAGTTGRPAGTPRNPAGRRAREISPPAPARRRPRHRRPRADAISRAHGARCPTALAGCRDKVHFRG